MNWLPGTLINTVVLSVVFVLGGGTFHGEMDRCRKSQGWTTACSSMPERDGKDQGEESPKQACSCWFTRHSWLAISGANLYPPGRCRVVFFWRCVLFLFNRFAEALRSVVPCMHAPRQPQAVTYLVTIVCATFCSDSFLVSWEASLFPSILYSIIAVSSFVFRVPCTLCVFLPDGVFLTCHQRPDFDTRLCENSIYRYQSINY